MVRMAWGLADEVAGTRIIWSNHRSLAGSFCWQLAGILAGTSTHGLSIQFLCGSQFGFPEQSRIPRPNAPTEQDRRA